MNVAETENWGGGARAPSAPSPGSYGYVINVNKSASNTQVIHFIHNEQFLYM